MTLKLVRKSAHAHVLICKSCGDGFVSAGESSSANESARLRTQLENELLSGNGHSWQVRIVESGCLDVCPVGAVSVRLVGAEQSEHKCLTWTCEPKSDVAELLTEIKKHLIQK